MKIFSVTKEEEKGIPVEHNIKAPLWAVGIVHGTSLSFGYRNLPYPCFASTWNTVFLNPRITVQRTV